MILRGVDFGGNFACFFFKSRMMMNDVLMYYHILRIHPFWSNFMTNIPPGRVTLGCETKPPGCQDAGSQESQFVWWDLVTHKTCKGPPLESWGAVNAYTNV